MELRVGPDLQSASDVIRLWRAEVTWSGRLRWLCGCFCVRVFAIGSKCSCQHRGWRCFQGLIPCRRPHQPFRQISVYAMCVLAHIRLIKRKYQQRFRSSCRMPQCFTVPSAGSSYSATEQSSTRGGCFVGAVAADAGLSRWSEKFEMMVTKNVCFCRSRRRGMFFLWTLLVKDPRRRQERKRSRWASFQHASRQQAARRPDDMNKTGDSLMRTSWFAHPSDTTETNEQEINLTFIRRRCCNEVIISSFCFFQERWDVFESGKYSRAADN